METLAPSTIEWGVASRALPGQASSGDLNVVKSFPNGVLVAALDGIGHGEEAASAAAVARSILTAHADEPVIALIERCHAGLRATRGVAMSVASFNVSQGLITWLGVGNVQGVLLRRGQEHAAVLPVSIGDTLILATDGISSDFTRKLARNHSPQKAAESILARHGKATDDALVLVARYLRDIL
jgi:negative regulator of sigma-B (phosphoserine phosphatase)